jgi:hypothetical protein
VIGLCSRQSTVLVRPPIVPLSPAHGPKEHAMVAYLARESDTNALKNKSSSLLLT